MSASDMSQKAVLPLRDRNRSLLDRGYIAGLSHEFHQSVPQKRLFIGLRLTRILLDRSFVRILASFTCRGTACSVDVMAFAN